MPLSGTVATRRRAAQGQGPGREWARQAEDWPLGPGHSTVACSAASETVPPGAQARRRTPTPSPDSGIDPTPPSPGSGGHAYISRVHVYVHVPFCARRCSYCDFAIAVRRQVPTDDFVDDILREWRQWQAHPAWETSPVVDTLYFGGGTPSHIDPSGIARIVSTIGADRVIASGAEITLEANPDDVTLDRAVAWCAAGINRVSLGVQSFEPAVLAWMHRTHTAEQVPPAVEQIRTAGITDLSLDLIFGLPSALDRSWERDLDRALALEPHHLSLYGLTVEEHTPLGRWTKAGKVSPVDEERYAAEFLLAHRSLLSTGYEHYEVSNAARPGHRARHNSGYWRRAPFIGLGPSAHSGFGAERRWNLRDWQGYHDASATGGSVIAGQEVLDPEAVALEEVYLGLRTCDGLPASSLPKPLREGWIREGWAEPMGDRIVLTAEGWLRLDALAASVN
jgi:oxygen-independent coproporphyrinogen-3 oxidase